ncbi:mRNA cap guanine-N7 methyltransferase [Terramyces sp. JEL0728]|nr:mRNA cap guanine-N7 methyltransferase [Terramyces sp. JEL0728]
MDSKVAQHYNQRPELGNEHRKQSPIFQMKSLNNVTTTNPVHQQARIKELVALDIADVSVKQAEERYRRGNMRFRATFKALDCFSDLLEPAIRGYRFDTVSIQFAFHYAFSSEDRVRLSLKTISNSLKSGGYFLGTIPNSELIVKNLRENGLEFGNSVYKIRFEDTKDFPVFGKRYWFELLDAIDDCPEYLIHQPQLVK